MVEGTFLWEKDLTADMITKTMADKRVITTFPDLPVNLYDALKKSAGICPDKTALVTDEGREYSYERVLTCCEELADYLSEAKGVERGSHVGIMMHNTVEFCVAVFALSRLGAVTVALPSKFKQSEVLALAARADLKLILCEEDYGEWFAKSYGREAVLTVEGKGADYGYKELLFQWREEHSQRKPLDFFAGRPEDEALLLFTSGTTAQSKGVLLKNYQIAHGIEAYRRILHITENDCSVIATPIYHITGLVALLGLFITVGGTLYLHKAFHAGRVLKDAERYGFTFLHGSPTVFHLLMQEGEAKGIRPLSLASVACGSANMAKDKLARFHKWLPDTVFHTVYGLTETSSPAAIFLEDAAKSSRMGSSGKPIPGMYFRIVDHERREVPTGNAGEIEVKGSNVIDFYYRQKRLEQDWLPTGDIGYFDGQGYLYVVDRKKDMINRGGEKIWCYDVENEIELLEGIQNAAVVGIPDELYGESAAAMVELRRGSSLTAENIRENLEKRIAKYKIPVKIKIVDAIPQTQNGKTDKEEVRNQLMKE